MNKLIYIFILIQLFISCKTEPKTDSIENIKIKQPEKEKEIEFKYVTAKSGLNYRIKPKGKILGKFEYGEKLEVIEHTNVWESIEDNENLIEGEWLGINFNNKTIYTFGGYLSNKKVYKPIIHKNPTKNLNRKLRYLYFANGGITGYFNDGTVTFCPRCEPYRESTTNLYNRKPYGKYSINHKGELEMIYETEYEDEPIIPAEISENGFQEWAIIDYIEIIEIKSVYDDEDVTIAE